jgi:prolyl-tRNA editing enzyme YbaK/EbsC (Cys-tRNA(Pro) deacylase)
MEKPAKKKKPKAFQMPISKKIAMKQRPVQDDGVGAFMKGTTKVAEMIRFFEEDDKKTLIPIASQRKTAIGCKMELHDLDGRAFASLTAAKKIEMQLPNDLRISA